MAGAADQFEPISQPQRIYRHIGHGTPGEGGIPLGRGEAARSLWFRSARPPVRPRASVAELAQRLLLDAYAPASVLANRKYQGLYYFGPTDLYLRMPAGVASQDLLAAARDGLRPAIRAAFDRASHRGRRGPSDAHSVAVSVTAQIVTHDDEELVLLSFRDLPEHEAKVEAVAESAADSSRPARTEQELDATRKEIEGGQSRPHGLLARRLKGDDLQLVRDGEEAVTAMSGMLNSLLDINQLEAGVIHPDFANFAVNDLLDRMKTEFAFHMRAHGAGIARAAIAAGGAQRSAPA